MGFLGSVLGGVPAVVWRWAAIALVGLALYGTGRIQQKLNDEQALESYKGTVATAAAVQTQKTAAKELQQKQVTEDVTHGWNEAVLAVRRDADRRVAAERMRHAAGSVSPVPEVSGGAGGVQAAPPHVGPDAGSGASPLNGGVTQSDPLEVRCAVTTFVCARMQEWLLNQEAIGDR